MPAVSPSRQARVNLSSSALRSNLRLFQSHLKQGAQVLAVVKADAYGHGAAETSQRLQKWGIENFGVATLEEGVQLRKAGIKGTILVLGPVHPDYIASAAGSRLTLTAWSLAYLSLIEKVLIKINKKISIHTKLDTGMHRLGISPSDIPALLKGIDKDRWPSIAFTGAYTHFASDGRSKSAVAKAFSQFINIHWPEKMLLHACNSSTALNIAEAQLSLVRPGIFLYGAMDQAIHAAAKQQRPVLSLSAPVVRIMDIAKGQGVSYGPKWKASKKTKVAVIALGYADGLPRSLSNKGRVLIQGVYCPLIGTICMDLVMADISKVVKVKEGTQAVFLGSQGKNEINIAEWARIAKTITYELLSRISTRLPRVWR